MDKKTISDYLAQPDYKNKVLAKYLKDNLSDTRSFIQTCSKEELIKVYAVIENVVLHFMDKKIVNIFKSRKGQLHVKISDNLSILNDLFDGYKNENRLLIKSIVDEIDPLHLIESNASYTCYNDMIDELNFEIKTFTLNHIACKVQKVFKLADPIIIQELSERLLNAFKDGSIKKFILHENNYINYISHSTNEVETLRINLFTHGCDYNIAVDDDDDFDDDTFDGEYAIELSSFLLKLLCNELSSTSFDLNNCTPEEYASYKHFEEFYTYKNGKKHILLIDATKKRYIYDIEDIDYFNYMNEKNQFIFDAIYNGIKKYGFKEFVINQDQ